MQPSSITDVATDYALKASEGNKCTFKSNDTPLLSGVTCVIEMEGGFVMCFGERNLFKQFSVCLIKICSDA